MQTYHVIDEFGNDGDINADTPEEAIARWSDTYEQNPLIHHAQVQAHTSTCGGTCWERLNRLGPDCLATTVHLDPPQPLQPPPGNRVPFQSYTLQWKPPAVSTPQVQDDLARIAGQQGASTPAWRTGAAQDPATLHSTAPSRWPNQRHDMARLSTLHPQVTFTLECTGPADHDRRREYHHQGLMQTAQGRWTYDPPDPTAFAPPPGAAPPITARHPHRSN